jgi:superfamily II DNA or RNA helicase
MIESVLLPHQRDALRAVVMATTVWGGALLADAVGSGKSYVALAAIERALDSNRKAILVIPAMLQAQWNELLHRFSLEVTLLTHDSLRWRSIIPGQNRDSLVVVDEAHAFRNDATQRHAALSRLVVGAQLLLVTATPFCNSARDLLALLQLFAADDRFAAVGVSSIEEAFARNDHAAIGRILRAVVIRRSIDEMKLDAKPIPQIARETISIDHEAELRGLMERLGALELSFVARSSRALFVEFFQRQIASSHAAGLLALRRQRRYLWHVSNDSRTFSRAAFFRLFGDDESEPVQQLMFADWWSGGENAVDRQSIARDLRQIDAIISELSVAVDTKSARLQQLITTSVELPVIVFTRSVETARHLSERFAALHRTALLTARFARVAGVRCTPSEALSAFVEGRCAILITTDLASEGLNLQNAATVIHYDLPWNHVKLQQRDGRAARLGAQRRDLRSVLFVREEVTDHFQLIRKKERVERELFDEASSDVPWMANRYEPPLLRKSSPQSQLFAQLQRLRILDLELRQLLTFRYPSGAERVLSEMTHEQLDLRKSRALRKLLSGAASWRRVSADR